MADLGQAYVQIIPSTEGISDKITSIIDPSVTKAGQQGGKSLSASLGQSFSAAGKTMSTFVTVPLAAVGAAAVAAFNEVDVGLDTIIQKTGTSGETIDGLKESFNAVASSVPASFEDVGAAIGEVNTRFGVTGEALESLSGQFIKFAKLNGTDVSSSVDSVQKALAAFGLGAEDAGALLDRLNVVGQATGASVDGLAAGLVRNGAAFQAMGMNIDQAATFMGQLEMSGANADTVMSGLSKALKNATKDGKPLNTALEELQNSILNGTDGVDGLTAAYDLFGKSGDQVYAAIQNGTLDFNDLSAAVSDAGGSVSDTFEATLDPADRMKAVLNELKIVGADLGGTLGEALMPAIQSVADVIHDVADAWNSLSPETQNAIVKAALIAAAIGPVISGIMGVINMVKTVQTAISGVSSAMTLLTSGPIGWIVAGIAAVIAAGVLLYTHWDEVVQWATNLKEKITEAWDSIKGKISGAVENIKANVSDKWNSMKEKVGSVMDSIKSNVSSRLDTIKAKYKSAGGGIKGVVAASMETVRQVWSAKFAAIDALTGGKLTAIKNKFSEKLNAAKDKVKEIIEKIKGFFNFSWDLPKLKLPHVSITGKFSLVPPSVPKFGLNWYKTGGVFDQPSVIGVAEAGKEAVIPLSGGEMRPFARAIAEELGSNKQKSDGSRYTVEVPIVLDGRTIARATAKFTQEELDKISARDNRKVGIA